MSEYPITVIFPGAECSNCLILGEVNSIERL